MAEQFRWTRLYCPRCGKQDLTAVGQESYQCTNCDTRVLILLVPCLKPPERALGPSEIKEERNATTQP